MIRHCPLYCREPPVCYRARVSTSCCACWRLANKIKCNKRNSKKKQPPKCCGEDRTSPRSGDTSSRHYRPHSRACPPWRPPRRRTGGRSWRAPPPTSPPARPAAPLRTGSCWSRSRPGRRLRCPARRSCSSVSGCSWRGRRSTHSSEGRTSPPWTDRRPRHSLRSCRSTRPACRLPGKISWCPSV